VTGVTGYSRYSVGHMIPSASVIVTSNKPFGRWGEVFGDATVAAAMIDRLVHHAEVVNLKGESYRLKDKIRGGCLAKTRSEG
jgi:DNA replication protein DnaC